MFSADAVDFLAQVFPRAVVKQLYTEVSVTVRELNAKKRALVEALREQA